MIEKENKWHDLVWTIMSPHLPNMFFFRSLSLYPPRIHKIAILLENIVLTLTILLPMRFGVPHFQTSPNNPVSLPGQVLAEVTPMLYLLCATDHAADAANVFCCLRQSQKESTIQSWHFLSA